MNFIDPILRFIFTVIATAFTVVLFGALAKAWWLLFMLGWQSL